MRSALCILALLLAAYVPSATACDIVVGGGFVQSSFAVQAFAQPVFAPSVFAPQFGFSAFGQRQVFVQSGVCGSAFAQPVFVRQRVFVQRRSLAARILGF